MAMPDKMTARYFSGYGFEAPVIIDVGVLGGTPFLYDSFPNAKFLLIDALEESEDAVRETWGDTLDFEFVNAALGATAGRVPIAIEPERPSRTSLSARADLSEDHFERDVPMLPLDQITDGRNGPFGLKIDTEGHELEVLKGATATLERCEFVIAEVSIKKRFAQGYRFSDV
ncbi:MAG: FkbM family methyltransferase, partial [Pseudomonadota bacterium]